MNKSPVFTECLHHVHMNSFQCRELSSKKSFYSILIINHLSSWFAMHVFWIKMEKSFKQESISKKLSTFLSEGKENVAGYETKPVNKKEVTVEIWCEVSAKTKNKLKSSVKRASIQFLKAFTCGMNNTKHEVSVQCIYFWVDMMF